jgi:MFS transporter, ACS family, D-galactonate transporter
MTLGFAAYGYTFYLFLTWLPGYLETEMHMSVLKSSMFTVIPWSFATVTDLVIGGWLVDFLVKRGYSSTRVRKTVVVIGMILGLAVFGAATTRNAHIAIIYITISLSGLAFAAPVGWSIPALIAPKGTVGMVGSIMNFANNIMGILAPIITGFVASGKSGFGPGFAIAGAVLVIGILCYIFLIGEIKQIPSPFEDHEVATPARS